MRNSAATPLARSPDQRRSSSGDFDNRPVYIFSFVIDQDRARDRPGTVRIGLGQKFRDALDALGDEHYPTIRMLSREDWDKRARA
ncbi:MAG: hypothetical protein WCC64_02085 [Aliidongia sp.]